MSRTDLDATTLANNLRMKAGDGSVEWVTEPIQASVLLDIADMLDENAKLVDVLHEVEAEAVYAYHCLQQDCVTTANSSEHFFKKWWHAECELDRLNAENAKLRELCADMLWTIKHAHGWYKNDTHEMLMTDVRGRDGEPTNVSHSLTTDEEMYEKRMRELGVEVTE